MAELSQAVWLLHELRPLSRAPDSCLHGLLGVSSALACCINLSASTCPNWSLLSSPKPASPLLCLTPARNWGATLPLSFTPHERSHPSCPFNFLNHLRLSCLSTSRTAPQPRLPAPLDSLSSAPRPVPLQMLPCGRSCWAPFACPAGGPCGF